MPRSLGVVLSVIAWNLYQSRNRTQAERQQRKYWQERWHQVTRQLMSIRPKTELKHCRFEQLERAINALEFQRQELSSELDYRLQVEDRLTWNDYDDALTADDLRRTIDRPDDQESRAMLEALSRIDELREQVTELYEKRREEAIQRDAKVELKRTMAALRREGFRP